MAVFIHIFSKNYFLNGNHIWPLASIDCKNWCVFQVEIKKKNYLNCCPDLSSNRLRQHIESHPNS